MLMHLIITALPSAQIIQQICLMLYTYVRTYMHYIHRTYVSSSLHNGGCW